MLSPFFISPGQLGITNAAAVTKLFKGLRSVREHQVHQAQLSADKTAKRLAANPSLRLTTEYLATKWLAHLGLSQCVARHACPCVVLCWSPHLTEDVPLALFLSFFPGCTYFLRVRTPMACTSCPFPWQV